MAQLTQKRQKALERQAVKRKQKAADLRRQHAVAPDSHGQIKAAGTWPLLETLLTEDWNGPEGLVEALVARRSPSGRIAAATFLIDLSCLGVKNAGVGTFETEGEYVRRLRLNFLMRPRISGNINLIAKIIREGIAYAADLGFTPHPDYLDAAYLLGDADPNASPAEVPLGGPDGKPLYVPGPYDNFESILMRLERRLGLDGFNVVFPLEMLLGDDDFDEMLDDEDEDFEEG